MSRSATSNTRPTGSSHGIERYVPANSILIPPETTLPSSKLRQAMFDVFAIGFAAFFIGLCGIGIAVSFFILFFVSTG